MSIPISNVIVRDGGTVYDRATGELIGYVERITVTVTVDGFRYDEERYHVRPPHGGGWLPHEFPTRGAAGRYLRYKFLQVSLTVST